MPVRRGRNFRGGSWAHVHMLRRGIRNSVANPPAEGGSSNAPTAEVFLQTTFDGTDAGTDATDGSQAANTVNFNGNAALAAAEKKFGTTSLDLPDVTTDFVHIDNTNQQFNLGSGDWEIDGWVYCQTTAGGDIFAQLCADDNGSTDRQWQILISNNSIFWQWSTNGTTWSFVDTGFDVVDNTWHHISVRKIGNYVYYSLDGKIGNIVTDFSAVTLFAPTANASLQIGTGIDGYVDDFRVTIGKAFHPYPGSFIVADDSFGSSTVDSEWDYTVPTASTRHTGGIVSGLYDWRDAGAQAQFTDANPGGGGANDSGLDPILDVIDSVSRRLTGIDFSPDGTKLIACSYSGNLASFSLSTAWDISTATQTGTTKASLGLITNLRFIDGGNRICYMGNSDRMYTMSLATQWQVASSDTPDANSITKATIGGRGTQSYDGIFGVVDDGTYAYGMVRDATAPNHYYFNIGSLSTPFDLSTYTGRTEVSFGTNNIISSPTSGSLKLSDDGTQAQFFCVDGSAESLLLMDFSTPYDASTGVLRPHCQMPNVTQNYDMAQWTPDMRSIFVWDGIFIGVFDRFDLYTIPSV